MDPKELRGLVEVYQQVNAPQEVDEAKQESDEEDWRKSEIRNLRRHRQTGTTTPYRDRLVSHTKGRGVKKERGSKVRTEEVDIFDTILEHLIAEGYADTNEAAIAIMANMSEEWRDSILSEEPVQDYRDMVKAKLSQGSKSTGGTAAQNPQPRSREFSRAVTTPKGPKSSGSAAIKLQPRGREFTNPPS